MYRFIEPLDWGAFVTTIISVNILWWLWDIPLIWRRGFRAYIDAITWECIRIYMPAVAGIFAIYHTDNRSRWPKLYYYGGRDEALVEIMTDTEVLRIVATDSLTITATFLTICLHYIRVSNWLFCTALWAFPSLQVSLIGIWILAASYTKTCPRRHILVGGVIFIFAIGVCVGIILMCSSGMHVEAWLPATMLYFFMATPFCLYSNWIFITVIVEVAAMARVGGFALTALLPGNPFMPSPSLKHPLFGTAYLFVGIVGGLLAITGRRRLKHICMVLEKRKPATGQKQSLVDRGLATLSAFQTGLREKWKRRHIAEKDGRAVGSFRWSQRQSRNYQQIIQPPERAHCSELMAEEFPRRSGTVYTSPDEEIRRNISTSSHLIPANVIQISHSPILPRSIESVFFSDTPRTWQIKRKPVGSGSRRKTRLLNYEEKCTLADIQKPKPVACPPQNISKNKSNGSNHSSSSFRIVSEESDTKRKLRLFDEKEEKIVHIQPKRRPQSVRSKPLPKLPTAVEEERAVNSGSRSKTTSKSSSKSRGGGGNRSGSGKSTTTNSKHRTRVRADTGGLPGFR